MSRPPRVIDPYGTYHVVHRGDHKDRLFRSPKDYRQFIVCTAEAQKSFSFRIFHYCVMPNHVHLLLSPNGCELSAAMQRLFVHYARYFNFKYERSGHVWQERFKTTPVLTDQHLIASGAYIEMNPVRAKLVSDPISWPYSSVHHYIGASDDPIVTRDVLYDDLGSSDLERATCYLRSLKEYGHQSA